MTSEPGLIRRVRDEIGQEPEYGPIGVRHIGGVNVNLAFPWNVRTCRRDVKGERQASRPRKAQRTEARHRGGATRSSEDVS
jgi:hypothetical protein